MGKDVKSSYEVVMASKQTGLWKTVFVNAISLKFAESKAYKLYDKDYFIFEVHEK